MNNAMIRPRREPAGAGLDPCSDAIAALYEAAASAEHWRDAVSGVARRLEDAIATGRLALATLDQLAAAAFIVDATACVRHANTAARALVASDARLIVCDTRLSFESPAMNRAFHSALRSAARGVSSLLAFAVVESDIIELSVTPLAAPDAATLPWGEALAVVVAQPCLDAGGIARRVRGLYGLTDAEARVMAALAIGMSVEQIAHAHGVRMSTVRAQVRSLFGKTGASRQTHLVRLALTGTPIRACAP